MKILTYTIWIFISLITLSACSKDEVFCNADIVGKWQCYRMESIREDAKTGEILDKLDTPKASDGADSTYIVAFYENNTGRYLDRGDDKTIWRYEVKGNVLNINNGVEFNIDELTNKTMILRREVKDFDYDIEKWVKYISLKVYNKVE